MTTSDQKKDGTAVESSSSSCSAAAEARLCANGCGFFGSPATMNLCSSCFKANLAIKLVAGPPLPPPPAAEESPAGSRRCGRCRRKAGVVGFVCRCGRTFCGAHRHPEDHSCDFDFRAAGREAIRAANPLLKPDKIIRF